MSNTYGYLFLLSIVIVVVTWAYMTGVIEHYTDQKNHEQAKFINFDTHDKPYANNAPFYIYQWWKYGLEPDKYTTCDQYRCRSPKYNGANAKPFDEKYKDPHTDQQPVHDSTAIPCDYYENMAAYCAKYPHDTICPNYWIYDPKTVGEEPKLNPSSY